MIQRLLDIVRLEVTLHTSPSSEQATTELLVSAYSSCLPLRGSVREMEPRPPSQGVVWPAYSRSFRMQAKIQKWGNSLGVRIPRGLAEEVGLGAGTDVSLSAKDGELVLRPSVPSRLRLADLLADVTPENIHTSIETGDAVGAEAF